MQGVAIFIASSHRIREGPSSFAQQNPQYKTTCHLVVPLLSTIHFPPALIPQNLERLDII